ncbi:MAG TPA: BrnT family toxin [Acetobacteraceae bacterium]|nr:BrnT family toxin [Acetobacteraceae bacterium]
MNFEWNEGKRLGNIDKHGLDFLDADILFAGPHLIGSAKTVVGESRWLAIGMIDEVCVTIIFTRRDQTLRLISMRRARDAERRHYQQLFGG